MKLVFPNGESDQVQLKPGNNTVGSADDCDVVLKVPGIAARHAEIELGPNGARIGVHDATNITRVNGTLVAARTPISTGDALLFANVQCQVAGDAPSMEQPAAPAAVDDAGATKVRMAIPMFVLRGVSGSTFGKSFPLHGSAVIGRQADCDICLAGDEISRRHAEISVGPGGLTIKDLDSANGTFVNGKRVTQSELKPGDEVKLDTVRFLVQTPGMDPPTANDAKTAQSKAIPEDAEEASSPMVKIAIAVTLIIVAGVVGLKLAGIV